MIEISLTSLEVTLAHDTLEASTALLKQESSKSVRTLVVTFSGTDLRRPVDATFNNNNNGALLTGSNILAFFRVMAEYLPRLETLRLEFNIILAQYYERPPMIPLKALQYILAETTIESLTIYRVQLAGDKADYERLAEAAIGNHSLQFARIEFCAPVGSPNLDAFVVSLSKLAGLRDFEIIGFQGDATRGCTSASLQTLGTVPPMLRCLKLWGGILQNQDTTAVSNLARGLNASKTIQDLEVGLFRLDASSSAALANLLQNNHSLERVWLDVQTPLHRETVLPLANAMKINNKIKSFNLVSTTDRLVDDGALEVFADVAKENFALRHLTIRGCSNELANAAAAAVAAGRIPVQRSQVQHLQAEIDFYLKLNRVGRRRLLNSASTLCARFQWLSALGCESENVSIVFYLLRRNPAFISQCVAKIPARCRKRQFLSLGPSASSSICEAQKRKRRRVW